MGRWQPDARGRLERAAMELYSEQGFERTTVAEIAERAGLTERTFFRHFADKREVLFSGSGALEALLVDRVGSAPRSLPPMEAIVAALVEASAVFEERREFAVRRQAIVAANAELAERESIKLARLASALAGALRRRGTADPAAWLAAEAGVSVFKVAFARWAGDSGAVALSRVIRQCVDELKAVTSGQGAPGRP